MKKTKSNSIGIRGKPYYIFYLFMLLSFIFLIPLSRPAYAADYKADLENINDGLNALEGSSIENGSVSLDKPSSQSPSYLIKKMAQVALVVGLMVLLVTHNEKKIPIVIGYIATAFFIMIIINLWNAGTLRSTLATIASWCYESGGGKR